MPKIVGMGYALPARTVENDELARELGMAAAEIERRTGVQRRHFAGDGEGPSDLARRAAEAAFSEARWRADDVELVVFATMTPDVTFPGSACYLQDKLGCGTVGALDVRAQCAGFLFALEVANRVLAAGAYRRVLVAAGDVHSSGLEFSPAGAEVTPLFGDGAAVALLDAAGDDLVETVLHTDATHFESFWCEFPSSRRVPLRFLPEDLEARSHVPRIERERVERDGLEHIVRGVREVLEKARVSARDVQRFFLHHLYSSTARRAAIDLGVSDRAVVSGRTEGHIASASLPIALCRAREAGEVRHGDLICLATAGSGANWAAGLLRV